MLRFSRSLRMGGLGLVAGAALIAAALPATAGAQSTGGPTVNIIEPDASNVLSWGFDNTDLVVPAGTVVTWMNTGNNQHTVTADDSTLDSGLIDPGNTFSFEFDTSGQIFTYHCTPHPWMKATIEVQ